MNKVYKSVWNASSGQWVAASELSRGRGKNASKGSVIKLVGATALAMASGAVWADCNISGTFMDQQVCTDESTVNINTNIDNPIGAIVVVRNATGSATVVNVNNSTLKSSATANGNSAMAITGKNGVEVNFKGSNTLELNTYGDTGVIASTQGVGNSGNVTINVQGDFALTNNSTSAWGGVLYERDGLEANTQNGNATINHTGIGKIETNIGNAIMARAQSATGDANVTLQGSGGKDSIELLVHGDNTAVEDTTGVGIGGIRAYVGASNTTGNVTVVTDAKITTQGNKSIGINTTAHGGKIDVTNTGTIATQTTTGSYAHGIYALNENGNTLVANNGSITTQGVDSAGIRAEQNAASTSGDITITTLANSVIQTSGVRAEGIHANIGSETISSESVSSGSIQIVADGSIKTTGNGTAEGIYAAITKADGASGVNTGNIDVTFKGTTIETTGTDVNRGIYTRQDGSGTTTVRHQGNQIKTAGDSAYGIQVITQVAATSGNVGVESVGKIDTAGKAAHGIFVNARNNVAQTTVINTGSINVTGADASAIQVTSVGTGDVFVEHKAGASVTSTGNSSLLNGNSRTDAVTAAKTSTAAGDVTIFADGNVTTAGANRSAAVFAHHMGVGNASVYASGNITASGTNTTGSSDNIYSYGVAATVADSGAANGNARVEYKNGTVTTGGDQAYALYAGAVGTANKGNAVVINTGGTLKTTGTGAHGIWSRNEATAGGDGLAYAKSTGIIATTGDGSHAIYANTVDGLAQVVNTGNLSTADINAYGIAALATGTGNINIANTGSIQTTHADTVAIPPSPTGDRTSSRGISAVSSGIGKITVNNTLSGNQSIQTSGNTSHAILAQITNTGDTGGIEINQTGGRLDTRGYDAHGVFVLTNAQSGDIHVNLTDTIIDLKGANSDGIDIQRSNSSTASNLNINVTTNGGSITLVDPTVAPRDGSNFGIIVYQYGAAAGDINITNNGTAITTHSGADATQGSGSIPIEASFGDATATGNINIINSGALSSQGINAKGMRTNNAGTGTINIANSGTITTASKEASGIAATAKGGGAIDIVNIGNITTQGNAAHGIESSSTVAGGAINIVSEGVITTQDARGIFVRSSDATASGEVTVTATNNITTGQATATTHNHGIDAGSNSGKSTVNYDQGTIKVVGTDGGGGNAIGIAAWDSGSGSASNESTINLGSSAIIDATQGVMGLQVRSNGKGTINIAQGAQVHGGSKAGIHMYGLPGSSAATYTLNNDGLIDSMNDRAIWVDGIPTGSTATITNNGTIDGYITAGNEDTTFTNNSSNSWNIRNFADTDGDGVRDTKAVAASDFGAGNDTLINTATGTIRLAAVNGAATTDTTGEYVPAGALSTSQSGIVQGQLLNLNRFENAGLIDMTANNLAGDVLVITGGTAAGTNGGGTYVSNGGSVKLDTVLNTGDTKSQSDILVVDNVTLGTGATKVFVTPVAGSPGGQTERDGIKVVEVLGTQDADSFALSAPLTYGAYEYILANGVNPSDNNWYLRNSLKPVSPSDKSKPLVNPNAGSYLGNQNAAANMFNINVSAARNHNRGLYDGSRPEQTLWFTANHNETRSDLFDGNQDLKIKTNLFQVGTDVLKREDYVLGVYGGFGTSSIENKSRQTGTRADGKVTGYHLGVYGSWAPEENKGPYVDAWGYYAWYQNKLKGAAQQYGEAKYDSTGYALAVQAGYGFEVLKQANGNTWVLEPHARLSYSDVDAESFYDKNNTRYSSNKGGGVQTQLGARFYGNLNLSNERTIKPYVELNWLHNASDNAINLNGVKMDSDIGKNVGEVKIGANAELTERLSLWGHVGAQRGSESFKRYEIEVGLGWKW